VTGSGRPRRGLWTAVGASLGGLWTAAGASLRGLWTAAGASFPGRATLPVGAPEPDGSRCGALRVGGAGGSA
jgi:hypothetical protein